MVVSQICKNFKLFHILWHHCSEKFHAEYFWDWNGKIMIAYLRTNIEIYTINTISTEETTVCFIKGRGKTLA